MLTLAIAGFMIGVVGSFHCVGMCGPIALALPVYDKSKASKLLYILLYNLGRMTAYAGVGVLFGFLGKQFFIGNYQRYLSVAMGTLILFYLFFSKYLYNNKSYISFFTKFVKEKLVQLFKSDKKFYTYIFIGFLNGLLPCGLVYVAIAGAVATGNILHSAVFMAGFGLGTFPVMFTVTIFGKFISLKWRNQMKRAVPAMVCGMALLLILRGMNLGIPYVSPELKATPTGVHSCCSSDQHGLKPSVH